MAAVLHLTCSSDGAMQQAWLRLLAACSLSLLLHLALIFGIGSDHTRGAPDVSATLDARLEPLAGSEQQARESALAPTQKEGAPARVAVRPKAAEIRAEPSVATIGGEEPTPSGDTTYYLAHELDVYPRPLIPIKLDYPKLAMQPIDARLSLLLLIDESGFVNEASVVEAHPEGYYDAAALSVLRSTRFAPAQKQGRAVKCQVLLQVTYSNVAREAMR